MTRNIKSEVDDFVRRAVNFGQRNGLNIPELALAFSTGTRCTHDEYLRLCKWLKDDENADKYYSGVELKSSRKPVKSALDTVRITFDNGETMVTDFNGDVSREECAKYYYGKWFNLGYRDDKEDDMHKVVKVEFPPFDEKISRNQASFNSFMRYK